MRTTRASIGISLPFMTFVVFALAQSPAHAMTAAEIDREVQEKLDHFYKNSDTAQTFGQVAKGILVFPDVYKAGFMVGGQFGEEALLKNGKNGRLLQYG